MSLTAFVPTTWSDYAESPSIDAAQLNRIEAGILAATAELITLEASLPGTYQPISAELSSVAALSGSGYAKRSGAASWGLVASIPQSDVAGLTASLAALQPLDADLTAIATLSTVGFVRRTAANTWSASALASADLPSIALSGEASGSGAGGAIPVTLSASAVVGKALSGYVAGSNAELAATDTILGAMGKIQGQISAREPALGNPSTSGYLVSSTTAGARSWVAPYTLPAATASVLGGVKVGTGLAVASGVLSVSYGTASGTAAQGNDSRLSDARTPTAHALDGALHTISGKTAGQILLATSATTFGFATLSGDATLSGAGALTLAASGVAAGSYGGAASVPVLVLDAKGRVTSATSAAITQSALGGPFLPLAGGTLSGAVYAGLTGSQFLFVGTGASLGDPGVAHTMRLVSQTNSYYGTLRLGTSDFGIFADGSVVGLRAAGAVVAYSSATQFTVPVILGVTGQIIGGNGLYVTGGAVVTGALTAGSVTSGGYPVMTLAGGTFVGALGGTSLSLTSTLGVSGDASINGNAGIAGTLSVGAALTCAAGLTTGAGFQVVATKNFAPASDAWSAGAIMVQRSATSGTTQSAGIAFHNQGLNAACLYLDAATGTMRYKTNSGNIYQLAATLIS